MGIRPTLRRLQENMLLASELRNHLVVHTPSRLTELAELSAVFDDMNQRLTIARSFVPEAILLGQESEEGNDEDGNEGAQRFLGASRQGPHVTPSASRPWSLLFIPKAKCRH